MEDGHDGKEKLMIRNRNLDCSSNTCFLRVMDITITTALSM